MLLAAGACAAVGATEVTPEQIGSLIAGPIGGFAAVALFLGMILAGKLHTDGEFSAMEKRALASEEREKAYREMQQQNQSSTAEIAKSAAAIATALTQLQPRRP